MAEIPKGCVEHQPDYKSGAWGAYSLAELGNWVHNLAQRSQHRLTDEKCAKDLHDAQNYLDMMQEKLDGIRDNI